MDKFKSQLSLHKKYRQSTISASSTSTSASTNSNATATASATATANKDNHPAKAKAKAKHLRNQSHQSHQSHGHEISSSITASTVSISTSGETHTTSQSQSQANANGNINANANNASRGSSQSKRNETPKRHSGSGSIHNSMSQIPFQPLGSHKQKHKPQSRSNSTTAPGTTPGGASASASATRSKSNKKSRSTSRNRSRSTSRNRSRSSKQFDNMNPNAKADARADAPYQYQSLSNAVPHSSASTSRCITMTPKSNSNGNSNSNSTFDRYAEYGSPSRYIDVSPDSAMAQSQTRRSLNLNLNNKSTCNSTKKAQVLKDKNDMTVASGASEATSKKLEKSKMNMIASNLLIPEISVGTSVKLTHRTSNTNTNTNANAKVNTTKANTNQHISSTSSPDLYPPNNDSNAVKASTTATATSTGLPPPLHPSSSSLLSSNAQKTQTQPQIQTQTQPQPQIQSQSESHNAATYYMVPTEAQLRWAQFHRKKRAQSVQRKIDELMSFPVHERDVDGALSDDGDSSECTSENENASQSESTSSATSSSSCISISASASASVSVSSDYCSYSHSHSRSNAHGYSSCDDGNIVNDCVNDKNNKDQTVENKQNTNSSNENEKTATTANVNTNANTNASTKHVTKSRKKSRTTRMRSCKKNAKRRRAKVKLSRGRRALLRVSERRTEERRKRIQRHGFAMSPENDYDFQEECECHSKNRKKTVNVNANGDTNGDIHGHGHGHGHALVLGNQIEDPFELDEITEALHVGLGLGDDNSLFTAERRIGGAESKSRSNGRDMGLIGSTILSSKKKKKPTSRKNANGAKHLKGKRSMVSTANEDEERMKRFEEAYLAMSNVVDNNSRPEEEESNETIKPSKRWTRGSNVPVAVSIDGRVYDDLQRSPAFRDTPSSRRYAAQTYGAELNELTDRVASWMMHLPKSTLKESMMKASSKSLLGTEAKNRNVFDSNEVIISPQKLKLMELVDRIQGKNPSNQPKAFDTENKSSCRRSEGKYNEENTSTNSLMFRSRNHGSKITHDLPTVEETPKKILSSFKIGVSVAKLRDKLFQVNGEIHNEISEEELLPEKFDMTENQLSDDIENKLNIMAAQVKSSNSVIDTDMQSDVSGGDFEQRIESLLLSPTIITKRLNQAINAIESCQWDQVSYLVSANPWLAEMPDINTDQYLLHKLAFHGAGNLISYDPAPPELHEEMLKVCPASIHKFDNEGNLPLHMAAAAGNLDMVVRLSELFPGGASVRNNNGLLPLHMSLLACSNNQSPESDNLAEDLVKVILDLFPGGLAVADNDGNLPIHLAACNLTGNIGAEVLHLLLSEAERLGDKLQFPSGVRELKHIDESISDFDIDIADEDTTVLMARNSMSWTPLMCGVKNRAGWQVLDVILTQENIEKIMFDTDENGKNILQLTLEEECYDPPSTLSILKFLPKLVTKPDFSGALPIETACIRGLQQEIIMAIALLDLPIDLDANDEITRNREEFGGSWWYLNCECDDAHTKIVKEILEICNYSQKRALCFAENEKGRTILRRATPKCKLELRKALRFVGRYEFIGSGGTDSENGIKLFEALDFGTDEDPIEEGQRVLLQYYNNHNVFLEAQSVLQSINYDSTLLVPMRFFHVHEQDSSSKSQNQHCIAIYNATLTLSEIISSMDRNNCRSEYERLNRYIAKLRKVFRVIGEGIYHLHQQGVVHGHINADSCGKFDDGWKLMDLIGAQHMGKSMSIQRIKKAAPPEAIQVVAVGRTNKVSIHAQLPASASIDIWGFGKLMYEVLVGKQIFPVDSHKTIDEDENFLRNLKNWDEDSLGIVVAEIDEAGAGTLAADLISHCLCPFPEHRPKSMKEILSHPYWNENDSQMTKNIKRRSRGGPAAASAPIKRRFQA